MRKAFIPSFIFAFILCGFANIFAQEKTQLSNQPDLQEQKIIYKKVEVVIEDNSDLDRIAALGIDLHCGANMQHKNGRHVATLELSTQDVEHLKSIDFQPKVLIEDMADFYEKRGIRELPKAREDLQMAKAAALHKNAEAGQDLGCSEDGFPVPQNFELGSMGGFTTYQEMLDELDQMRSLYPNLITARAPTSTTNSTIQGRDVFYVKLSDNPDVDENEAEVLYTGVHHAREPLGMMNQLYYMWYLLENYATDQKVRNIVDNTELYFIPVVNPDGYLYNQQTNPNGGGMWRKNRRNNGNGTYGVDPNRNYGYQWGLNDTGSSPNSSSDTYRGTGPFSEPETQMMRDFVQSHNFVNAFNNHSYSNLMLRPWGYTAGTHAEEELYDELSEHMCWHNRYHYGNGNEVIYPVNGEANDWFYGVEDILAWTPEIGSLAEGGFWPSPSDIVPQCDRQMKMSLILASSAANYGVLNDLTPYGLDASNPTLTFSVEHMSNIDGGFTVNVSSSSPYVTGITNSSMSTGTLTQANFATVSTGVTLAANTPAGQAITFDVVLNNGTYDIHTTTITKVFDTPTLISDNGSNLNNWTSSAGWGVTNSTGYSGSSSIADSPSGNMSTATRTLTLSAPLDLSSIQSPVLEYYTKWDISRLFDYVQIEASTNGSSWSELCGTYTKPGSSPDNVWSGNGTPDQPTGEGLYDGFQKEWVREEIDLSAYAGVNTLYLRFKADGDTERAQLDGFYFDDFTVYREPLGHCENGVQDADETGVDCGGADCIACPTCSDGIQNGNETGVDCGGPDCAICPPEYCPTYDFNVDPIIAYDPGQDFGPAIIQDGGATVYMDGNAWKALAINYTVTANTVLEFDFKSTVEGEIHEIGFDNDLTLAPDHRMVLYGNQGYAGTFAGGTYNGSGNWQSFAVPIGANFTGTFTYLVLTADDDANSAGNSYYRNVKIYEDEDGDLECDDLVCVVGDPCDDGDACTSGETYDNACNCTGGTLIDADNDGVCDSDDQCPGMDDALIGTACDDGDACTTGDVYDANCNCAGTVADADNDGVCDADDVCPNMDDALIGTACDDGDACTTGDVYDANCNCAGTVADADNDGVCDADDACPNMDDALIGTTCDDGDACTTGDVYDANCNCAGTIADADNDGVCDADDVCPNMDDALIGTACDDGDACTTGDIYDANCNCAGTVADADNDGVCDADDACPGMDDSLIGTACDDGNDCTTGDVYDANCGCAGTPTDADNDGVCDADDVCPNFDDALIGTPCDDGDACTTGETFDANCGCSGGVVQDADQDGVCDADDACPGMDDALIGTACDDGDACTTGDVYDANCGCAGTLTDADGDGVCDADDVCPNFDDTLIGTACDDGDPCTVGETYDANCGCSGGTLADADNDGVCDADDVCPNMDDALIGTACDDGDACTTGDVYDANCNCAGTVADADGDGVCDADDQCPGTDDAIIGTACDDGDACTSGETYDANCGCTGGTVADTDGDGVCDADDVCPLGDDNIDLDGNGTPDACDASDDCPAIDFMVDAPTTYGGGQDQGTVAVQDGGATIELNSNAWKMITVNYNVTANTVVEFDFKSNQIGEIHGVGFDNNTSISSNYTFKVYGTQNWGNSTFNTYSGSGSYEHFVIPIGQFYTGQFPYFFFVTDHDGSPQNGNSFFSNLQIYEDANGDGQCDGPNTCADSDADGVCDGDDICEGGDDNADADGDGTPDACDVCPNDPTDSCGSAPTYCGASGNNTNYEYIDRVIFGNIDNTSGANGGYGDFTSQIANVGLGDAVPFGLTPGFASSTYNEAWMVWIDFNRDGDFDDAGEAVYSGTSAGTLSGNITIPANASLGLTGMRVAMQWNNPAASCGTFTYGEVEDYTVNISATPQNYMALMLRNEDNLVADPSMRIYPNPSVDFINIDFQNIRDNGTIEIYDLSGKPIGEQTVESESDDLRVEVGHLPAGTYIIRLKFGEGTFATKRFVKLSN